MIALQTDVSSHFWVVAIKARGEAGLLVVSGAVENHFFGFDVGYSCRTG